MGRKGRFEGNVCKGKEGLKEEFLRKSIGSKGRFKGIVLEIKEGLKEAYGKANNV